MLYLANPLNVLFILELFKKIICLILPHIVGKNETGLVLSINNLWRPNYCSFGTHIFCKVIVGC